MKVKGTELILFSKVIGNDYYDISSSEYGYSTHYNLKEAKEDYYIGISKERDLESEVFELIPITLEELIKITNVPKEVTRFLRKINYAEEDLMANVLAKKLPESYFKIEKENGNEYKFYQQGWIINGKSKKRDYKYLFSKKYVTLRGIITE